MKTNALWLDLSAFRQDFILSLLSNMLDLNKFLAGEISLHPTRISVERDVVSAVVAMLNVSSKQVRVSGKVLGGPLWILADAVRLKQLAMNLVGGRSPRLYSLILYRNAWT